MWRQLDQKLNFLITRFFQKKFKKKIQIIVLFNLLIGLDEKKKMSKSINNCILINENIYIFFEKLLKISDNLLKIYIYSLSLEKNINFLSIKNDNEINYYKKIFYLELIRNFYNKKVSIYFLNKIEIKNNNIWPKNLIFYKLKNKYINFYNLFKIIKLCKSTNKSIFIIKQKFIKINNCLIINPNSILIKGNYIIHVNKKLNFYIKII